MPTRNSFALVVLVLISGCSSPRVISPDQRYAAPPSGSAVAFIRGTHKGGLLSGGSTAYVRAVDDKQIIDPKTNWNVALPIAPGKRRITIAFMHRGFFSVFDQELEVTAGRTYEIRFDAKISVMDYSGACDVWIADAGTGAAVTASISSSSNGGEIPMIPLPIPAH
jgi:hypothetical protein